MTKQAEKIMLTQEGYDKLKEELRILIETERPQIAHKIKTAREFGDLSENAAYQEAKEKQGFIEGKIAELEDLLKRASIIETKNDGTVQVGSKVKVHINGNDTVLHIVGAPEADPSKKKISHKSPIGAALLGKGKGESVTVEVPAGQISYTILEIE
jgi:transcription elongation factor GreA